MVSTIRILGQANGDPSPFDDQYLVEYDPARDAHAIVVTWYKFEAKQFNEPIDAMEYWQQINPKEPMRLDGKPNRPLTAFSVEIEND